MVMNIALFLLGTVAGLAISLITMDLTITRIFESMQFIEIEEEDE